MNDYPWFAETKLSKLKQLTDECVQAGFSVLMVPSVQPSMCHVTRLFYHDFYNQWPWSQWHHASEDSGNHTSSTDWGTCSSVVFMKYLESLQIHMTARVLGHFKPRIRQGIYLQVLQPLLSLWLAHQPLFFQFLGICTVTRLLHIPSLLCNLWNDGDVQYYSSMFDFTSTEILDTQKLMSLYTLNYPLLILHVMWLQGKYIYNLCLVGTLK